MIAVVPVPTEDRADVPVDGLDIAEGDLHVAVGEDPVQMAQEQLRQLLEGREGARRAPAPAAGYTADRPRFGSRRPATPARPPTGGRAPGARWGAPESSEC